MKRKKSEEVNSLRSTLIEHDVKIQQLLNNEKKLILERKQLENILKLNRQTCIRYKQQDRHRKSVENQLAQLEDSINAQNQFIEKLNANVEQAKQTLATEIGTIKFESTKLETLITDLNNKLEDQMRCSQNLENVLKQFSREREQQIDKNFRQYGYTLSEKNPIANSLTHENNSIGYRFNEYDQLLSDTDHLNKNIRKHYFLINRLIKENRDQDLQIKEYKREINLNNNLFFCQAPLSASTNSSVNTTDLTLNQEPSAALLPPTNVEENTPILDLSTVLSSTTKNRKFLDRLEVFLNVN